MIAHLFYAVKGFKKICILLTDKNIYYYPLRKLKNVV